MAAYHLVMAALPRTAMTGSGPELEIHVQAELVTASVLVLSGRNGLTRGVDIQRIRRKCKDRSFCLIRHY